MHQDEIHQPYRDFIMTPLQMMQTFNKKYANRKDVYRAMQQSYIAGNIKKGLFCDNKSLISMDADLMNDMSLNTMRNVLSTIGKMKPKKGEASQTAAEKEIAMAAQIAGRASREMLLGTRLFGTWRNSLGIYKIDDDMADQALKSLIPLETPSIIYANLPEWCVYIEVPKGCDLEVVANVDGGDDADEFQMQKVLGFWAMHDKQDYDKSDIGTNHDDNMVLNIFLHIDINEKDQYNNLVPPPIILNLDKNLTVAESIEQKYDSSKFSDEGILELQDIIKTVLSLLLWLCVAEPDVSNINGEQLSRQDIVKPKYKRHKKTGNFIAPEHASYYQIGKRLGGEMREHIEHVDKLESANGKRKRPHIRRGHWHGVWSGTGDEREFTTYWQSAIFVNSK